MQSLIITGMIFGIMPWRRVARVLPEAFELRTQLGLQTAKQPDNPFTVVFDVLQTARAALSTERDKGAGFEARLTNEVAARRRVEQELALLHLYHATLVNNVRHAL